MKLRQRAALLAAPILALSLLFAGWAIAAPQQQREFFSWIVTNRLTVQNAGVLQDTVDVWGALDVDGAVTLNSTLDVDGAISSGTGAITMTDNVVITGNLTTSGATTTVDDLDVGGDLDVTGPITAAGNTTVGGNLAVTGNGTIGDLLNLTAQTAISVTNGGTITPAGSYQPLTAAANVGTSGLVTSTFTAGDLLMLVNVSAFTITLTDTAPLKLSGNAVLTADDTALLLFDGASWVEMAQATN